MAIHTAAATGALAAAWLFRLPRMEWLFVILAIAGVVTAVAAAVIRRVIFLPRALAAFR
jgi:diacylglycerol kinase